MVTKNGLVKRKHRGKANHISEVSLQRRRRAWEMRCQGYTLQKIAEAIGISFQCVAKALNKAQTEFQFDFSEDMKREKDMSAQQYMWAMNESRQAWENSKSLIPEDSNRYGDPRHLNNFMNAGKAIRDIYSLDSPVKTKTTHDGQVSLSEFTLDIPNANKLNDAGTDISKSELKKMEKRKKDDSH